MTSEAVRARPRTYMVTERHDCLPGGDVSSARLLVTIDGNAAGPGRWFWSNGSAWGTCDIDSSALPPAIFSDSG